MKLVHKIALVLMAAAALPLGTAGFWLVATNERALESEVKARFDQTVRHAAEAVANDVEGRGRMLPQLAQMIDFQRLTPDELKGALGLLERQARATEGRLVPPGEGGIFARAEKEGLGAVVFAQPEHDSDGTGPARRVRLALAVKGGVLGFSLDVSEAGRRLEEVRGADGPPLWLVDDSGRPLVGNDAPSAEVIKEAAAGGDGRARRFAIDRGGKSVIAAFTPVGGLGWLVVAEEDAQAAFAVPRRMRRLTLAATLGSAALALGLALAFAFALTRRLDTLASAAQKLGGGALDSRVPVVDGGDEVAQLGRSFNAMAGDLQKSRAEIEAWNRELEARVAERTRELKEAQAQLVQAQKLAALGQLGAGVAHEINNPLGGVIGHVQLLLADKPEGDKDLEALRCIEEGARKASQVVQNLLRFSVQRKEAVRTSVDLNKVVKETLTLTETLLKDQAIEIALELDGGTPRLRGDAGQIGQVLLNLVSNARTAMPKGGRLRVATRKLEGKVELTVADNGKGIAPEIKERIFEPFFTTKDEWSNVGLGLSVSFRIVEEHGGRIAVESEPGQGSTFTVSVPA
jgi:two-component system, NtrC family, sensor kinase